MIGNIISSTLQSTTPLNYQQTILADSPVGFWMTNETSGTTAIDLGSGGNNGTYAASPTLNVSTGLSGVTKAVTYNGSTQNVNTAQVTTFNLAPSGNWSFEGWFKTSASAVGALAAVRCGNATSDGTLLCVLFANVVANKVSAYSTDAAGTGNIAVSSTTSINTGAYFHIAATAVSGGALTIYVNGVAEASSSAGRWASTQDRKMTIACQPSNTTGYQNFSASTSAAIAFYNTTLSASTVLAHYNKGI